MKLFWKSLSAIAVVVIGLFTLASCGSYDFYSDWHGAGADIEKENIYVAITLDEAKEKIDADETFVLVVGKSSATNSATTIGLLQSEAEYFEFDKKIYFMDASVHSKPAERKLVRDTLGMKDTAVLDVNLAIICYNDGDIVLDTSRGSKDSSLSNFLNQSQVIDYYKVAAYIFSDFVYE